MSCLLRYVFKCWFYAIWGYLCVISGTGLFCQLIVDLFWKKETIGSSQNKNNTHRYYEQTVSCTLKIRAFFDATKYLITVRLKLMSCVSDLVISMCPSWDTRHAWVRAHDMPESGHRICLSRGTWCAWVEIHVVPESRYTICLSRGSPCAWVEAQLHYKKLKEKKTKTILRFVWHKIQNDLATLGSPISSILAEQVTKYYAICGLGSCCWLTLCVPSPIWFVLHCLNSCSVKKRLNTGSVLCLFCGIMLFNCCFYCHNVLRVCHCGDIIVLLLAVVLFGIVVMQIEIKVINFVIIQFPACWKYEL